MRTYFLRRFLLIPPTLLGITLIVFMITRVVPGGPIERALMEARMADTGGGGAVSSADSNRGALSEEQMKSLKEYYGFDRPPLEAYFVWLGKVVRGDLGTSYRYNEPVLDIILSRVPISLTYGAVTLFLVYAVCIPLGILKAIKHRTFIDNATSALVFIGYAIPGYALGALLVDRAVAPDGSREPGAMTKSFLDRYALPAAELFTRPSHPYTAALLAAAVAAAAALVIAALARKRLGGYTGDTLGAAEQVAEIGALLVLTTI